MPKFKKKPVVIEAFQLVDSPKGPPEWFQHAIRNGDAYWSGAFYTIRTLEGEMRANGGDWIIRGIKGEIYPCKPDIFAATYERVSDPQ